MAEQRVVLVDGVAGYWGERVAERLLAEPDLHVIGLDVAPPKQGSGLDFIQTDMRNPLLADLLKEEQVDTYVHLAFIESDRPNEPAFDFNVMGTMKVLSACAAAGVKRVILRSSTLLYGAQPGNSAFLREEHPLNAKRNFGTLRDLLEIETFCQSFRAQAPHLKLTLLRFAHILGPTVTSPLTRFLRDEAAPTLFGFDPVIQIIHEADVVSALAHVTIFDLPGIYNIAAPGAMPLFKLTGLAGKLSIPVLHPFAYLGESILGAQLTPIDFDYLRYACVGDLRRMREELEFEPQYTAEAAVREFAAVRKARPMMPEELEEDHLRAVIERRKRIREQTAAGGPTRHQPRGHAEAEAAVAADQSLYEERNHD